MSGHDPLTAATKVAKLIGAGALAGVLVAAIALPAIGGVGIASRNGARYFQNMPTELKPPPLPQRSTILAANGSKIATFYFRNRIPVSMDEIADVMQKAMVAIEDSRFYQHDGLDMQGLGRAAITNLKAGAIVEGGSTLTQQYVENVLELKADTKKERQAAQAQSIPAKLEEMRLALAIEKELTKKQILNRYLNIAYFGDGAHGVEVAARHYFSKHAAKLTLTEAATIAATVKAPGAYNPVENPEAAKHRRNLVIDRMAELSMISKERAQRAKKAGLGLDVKEMDNGCSDSKYPFFCIYVREEIQSSKAFGKTKEERLELLRQGGLTIHTTLQPKKQRAAQKALRDYVPPKHSSGRVAAEAMVEPGTGKIRALAVSLPYGSGKHETSINFAANYAHGGSGGFQAGSTFKAFTLAAALQDHMPFRTTIHSPYELHPKPFERCDGQPYPVPDWTVHNFAESENQPYNMKQATYLSVNTYFVQLENRVGLCQVAKMASKLGLHKARGENLLPAPASFTLGTVNVAPLDMAAAYATFAARGERCDPIAITKVIDRHDKPLNVPNANCRQVISKGIADGVNYLLKGVLNQGTGEGDDIPRPAAGKTGTDTNFEQAWFVGYTPDLASAVWVGDPSGANPMTNITIGGQYYEDVGGSTIPAPIWEQSMQQALGPKNAPTSFHQPPGWMTYVPPKPDKDDKDKKDQKNRGDGGGSGGGPPDDRGNGGGPPGNGNPGDPLGNGNPGDPPGNGNSGGHLGWDPGDPPPGQEPDPDD